VEAFGRMSAQDGLDPPASNQADPPASNPADPPAGDEADLQVLEKDVLGEKKVLREMIQKVEDLLRALGRFTAVPAGPDPTSGAPVAEPTDLEVFLKMNPEEGFDLEALNAIDLRALQKEARGEKQLLREVMQKVEELLPRVHSETGVPALVGAVLRNKTLVWYRQSPSDPRWAEKLVPRWGGMFSESRIPGGRLSPGLSDRLANLHSECAKSSGWAVVLSRAQARAGALFGRISLLSSLILGSKRHFQPIIPQVAQAYLDDLAARGRGSEGPLPLERLTRLARQIGPAELNVMLGELFPQEGGEPFVVLDAHLHPDTDGVTIRPPPPKAVGEGVTYDVVHPKASGAAGSGAPGGAATESTPGSPWERQDITKEEWSGVLGALEHGTRKLDPPPIEDYRGRPSYLTLRELILDDSSARQSFRAVCWKGKPSGVVLLSQLLVQGTFAPEVETDGDYLEAELTHIEKGDPDQQPPDGRWNLGHGWTVLREVAWGNVRVYHASNASAEPTMGPATTGPAGTSPVAPQPEELGIPAR